MSRSVDDTLIDENLINVDPHGLNLQIYHDRVDNMMIDDSLVDVPIGILSTQNNHDRFIYSK